jgi:hypothetical protein
MALQPSRYGYYTLGATEIRVVDIQPGQLDEPIHVSIRVVDLQNKPRYEALSYVWNPTMGSLDFWCTRAFNERHGVNKTHKIMVVTASLATYLPIGWNLAAAMRHLRHHHTVRTMWIDAISINQEDILERNDQVGLMGAIYSSAERVVVWLGPAYRDSGFAMEAISTGNFAKESALRSRDGLEYILKSDWFFRIWVVQEVTLGAEDPLLYCGPHCINWSQLVATVQRLGSQGRHTRPIPGEEWSTYLEELTTSLWAIQLDTHMRQVRNLAAIRTRGRTASFAQQFYDTLRFQSTDPRDKVYGLLGICCFRGTPIVPDYAKSHQEVFAEATAMIMSEDFTLYAHLQMWAGGFSSPWSIPTWASDLITGGVPSRINFVPSHPDNSVKNTLLRARGVAPSMGFSSEYKVLHTVGHYIGEIKQCAEVNCGMRIKPTSLRQAHEKIHKDGLRDYTELMISALLHQKGPRLWHRKDKLHSILREGFTPLNKTTSDPKHVSKEYASRDTNKSSDSDTDIDSEVENEYPRYKGLFKGTSWFDHASDFCIFTTNTGMLGLANRSLASRDLSSIVLAGLFGINMPFILEHLHYDEYKILGVFYAPEHVWGHDFIENAAPGTDCNEFVADGRLKRYNIR